LASGREYFAAVVWIAEDFFPFTRMHALATSEHSHVTCRSPDVAMRNAVGRTQKIAERPAHCTARDGSSSVRRRFLT
jgi:hypothetical protein